MSNYKVQQFTWGFRMYDKRDEQAVTGSIADFDVSEEDAELINKGAEVKVVDGQLVITEQALEGEIL